MRVTSIDSSRTVFASLGQNGCFAWFNWLTTQICRWWYLFKLFHGAKWSNLTFIGNEQKGTALNRYSKLSRGDLWSGLKLTIHRMQIWYRVPNANRTTTSLHFTNGKRTYIYMCSAILLNRLITFYYQQWEEKTSGNVRSTWVIYRQPCSIQNWKWQQGRVNIPVGSANTIWHPMSYDTGGGRNSNEFYRIDAYTIAACDLDEENKKMAVLKFSVGAKV